jgi:neutral ceramidase
MKRIFKTARYLAIAAFGALFQIGILFVFGPSDTYAQGRSFQAGASTANISPKLGEGIAGGWMPLPLATHIHDELHARSLVLDDGEVTLVLMVVDNVELPREVFDAAKELITQETKIPKELIMMSSTHTHSSTWAGHEIHPPEPALSIRGRYTAPYPKPLNAYQQFVVRRMADGVRTALNNLEPARIAWGTGSVPQHVFNRRWKLKSPVMNPFGTKESVMMNPGIANPNIQKPAGPTDPEVSFFSVQSKAGRPIALFANYSLHYVGGVPNGHISADYFAMFADRIQELLKVDGQDPRFVGIMSNGTEGDINNVDFRGPAVKQPPYAKMKIVADDVAEEVFKAYQTLVYKSWVSLQAAQTELTLNVRKPDREALAWADMAMLRSKPDHPLEKVFAERLVQMKEWPEKIDVILQTFKIGELGIAAIPFEVFAETGLEIKSKSPFEKTFTVGLANGGYGYLPTPEQHELGGYETWLSVNKVEKEASRKITAEILKLFKELK